MRAAVVRTRSGPFVVEELRRPEPQEGEVLVRVTAAGVNRADLVQAQGNYPPPKGEPDTIGLECAGVIVDPGTTGRTKG